MAASEERKAQNEAIFRDANEEVAKVRDQLTEVEGRTPFFCECEDTACRELVRLTLDQYEAVRADPTTFLIAPGHPSSTGELVETHREYVVVSKTGVARQIAEATDPRSNDG